MKKYTGVTLMPSGRYQCRVNGKHIGMFDSVLEAVIARDKYKREHPYDKRRIVIFGFADRLNEAIWKSDLDLVEICRRSKISRSALWGYRYTGIQPPAWALARLATTLNVSSDYLLGIERKEA